MIQDSYNIADNLPESLQSDNVKELAQLIDEKLHELNATAEVASIYPRIDELSSDLIDALAIQFHVDFYDSTLSLTKRRNLVKNSIRWHVKKGTRAVVQEMANTVFGSASVLEWFEYGGDPYRFKIDLLAEAQMTPETARLIVQAIETVKNVRSWLESIGFIRYADSKRYFGIVPTAYIKHETYQLAVQSAASQLTVYRGVIPSGGFNHVATQLAAVDSSTKATIYHGVVPSGGITQSVTQLAATDSKTKATVYCGAIPTTGRVHNNTQQSITNSIVNATIYRGLTGSKSQQHYINSEEE